MSFLLVFPCINNPYTMYTYDDINEEAHPSTCEMCGVESDNDICNHCEWLESGSEYDFDKWCELKDQEALDGLDFDCKGTTGKCPPMDQLGRPHGLSVTGVMHSLINNQ